MDHTAKIFPVFCESKKTNDIFRSYLCQMPANSKKKYFTLDFSKQFAIKSLSFFPTHLNYVATLPCQMYKIKNWEILVYST